MLEINNRNRNSVEVQTLHSSPLGSNLGRRRIYQLYCLVWPRTLLSAPASSSMSHICKCYLWAWWSSFLPLQVPPGPCLARSCILVAYLLLNLTQDLQSLLPLLATVPSQKQIYRSHNGADSCLLWSRTFTSNYPSSFK